ncbi:HalOD1 output domain-containing protein [Halorussus halophilus]|uniref:HalOD1 output domain-containing protein n=1 Tax=Halorussus halophilus TaxID=2650975 RepID=UPI00130106B7|nr:HalOD1 output domain-containing protein [Halorussus halophilus]
MNVTTNDTPTEPTTQKRTPKVSRSFDGDDRLSTVVIEAVADAIDCDPHEVTPPLHRSVDLDALDSLFGTQHDGTPRTGGHVAFDHGDCRVLVDGSRVSVYSDA